jgi:hypothetical protein
MRHFACILLGFASFLFAASAQAVVPAFPVSIGTHTDWSFARQGGSTRYRAGSVEIVMEGAREAQSPDLIQPRLTVEYPGYPPVTLIGADTPPSQEHRFAVGRWDAKRLFVLFQSFSGGAHCCTQVQLVLPDMDHLQVIDFGEWDGGYSDRIPSDLDGDGAIDFVFYDNAFLYAFASYAESGAPPLVMNVVDGDAVDVSDRPGFRYLFEDALREHRQYCLRPRAMSPNGACAAYVAAAARVGRFDQAWGEMLRAYDPRSRWDLPTDCASALVDRQCPENSVLRFRDYPDALRHFLAAQGYISR